jgi:hypothetical protein
LNISTSNHFKYSHSIFNIPFHTVPQYPQIQDPEIPIFFVWFRPELSMLKSRRSDWSAGCSGALVFGGGWACSPVHDDGIPGEIQQISSISAWSINISIQYI